MSNPSHDFDFDSRLLTIEELFRQRKFSLAGKELSALDEQLFDNSPHELGLFLLLLADEHFNRGNYRQSLEMGQRSAKILASMPLNRRYGKALLVLSKTYSSLGDMKLAEMRAYDARGSYRRAVDIPGQVDALNELASITFMRSDYGLSAEFLDEAIKLAKGDDRKIAQLTGNAGRVKTLSGSWEEAESDLKAVIEYDRANLSEVSLARNLLSLGYLHGLKREFVFAEASLREALELIEANSLKREKIIYLEYSGEIAFEKGDSFKAKSILTNAYQDGKMMAPDSAMVVQSGRRLAEVEFSLDNTDAAMNFGQKALELALAVGEKAEVVMSRRIIAEIFASKSDFSDALDHIRKAVEQARAIGDPLVLARSLLSMTDILMLANHDEIAKIRTTIDEATRIFKRLKLNYWVAEAEYRAGVFACQHGDLSRGFKKLSRSERTFQTLGDSGKVRRVNQFLSSLATQAIALSISAENSYKLFGNMLNQPEMSDVRDEGIDGVIQILRDKSSADRVIIYTPDYEDAPIVCSEPTTALHQKRFIEAFTQLLGQEISSAKPTLMLDCRRDPYINDLFPESPEIVASVIVVPFTITGSSTSYIYLDKLSNDNMLNPFSQLDLNFAVGFSDIIAFKSAELQKMKLQEDNRRLKEQLYKDAAFPNIITRNAQMLEILAQVRRVVDANISISIEGDTGCGKDLLARAIHYNSFRRDKRFISVNCAALPETLLESELFGYKRGAFTGADRDKPGLFEEADGGTFFLDEIADMPLSVQAKILRVLEEKEVVRLGESVPKKVDVRILSATNKDLKEMMAAGLFRSDLYYRLSALTFRLPAIKERREDIPLLIDKFLEGSNKKIAPVAMQALIDYDWPGNVRELENEIKKIILLSGDAVEISTDVLSSKLGVGSGMTTLIPAAADQIPSMDDLTFSDEYSLYDYLAAHERKFIIRALRERNGVKKHAAAALNIPESTLRLKIKQYSIDISRIDSIN